MLPELSHERIRDGNFCTYQSSILGLEGGSTDTICKEHGVDYGPVEYRGGRWAAASAIGPMYSAAEGFAPYRSTCALNRDDQSATAIKSSVSTIDSRITSFARSLTCTRKHCYWELCPDGR